MMHICIAVLLDTLAWFSLQVTGSEGLRFLMEGGSIASAVCWRVKWAQLEHTEQRDLIEGSPTFSPPTCFPADKLNIWFGSMEQGRSVSFMSWEVHVCGLEMLIVPMRVTAWNPLIRLQLGWSRMAGKTINKAPTVSRIKHTHTIKSRINIVSIL